MKAPVPMFTSLKALKEYLNRRLSPAMQKNHSQCREEISRHTGGMPLLTPQEALNTVNGWINSMPLHYPGIAAEQAIARDIVRDADESVQRISAIAAQTARESITNLYQQGYLERRQHEVREQLIREISPVLQAEIQSALPPAHLLQEEDISKRNTQRIGPLTSEQKAAIDALNAPPAAEQPAPRQSLSGLARLKLLSEGYNRETRKMPDIELFEEWPPLQQREPLPEEVQAVQQRGERLTFDCQREPGEAVDAHLVRTGEAFMAEHGKLPAYIAVSREDSNVLAFADKRLPFSHIQRTEPRLTEGRMVAIA